MGFTTFKVEVLRLLSAYLHRAASAYLCHGALSAECKYVSEFVYLLNISSKGLVTQCPLCLNRDLCASPIARYWTISHSIALYLLPWLIQDKNANFCLQRHCSQLLPLGMERVLIMILITFNYIGFSLLCLFVLLNLVYYRFLMFLTGFRPTSRTLGPPKTAVGSHAPPAWHKVCHW